MNPPSPDISPREPLFTELAIVLAQGYRRLAEKARNPATTSAERRLDLLAEESPDGVEDSA